MHDGALAVFDVEQGVGQHEVVQLVCARGVWRADVEGRDVQFTRCGSDLCLEQLPVGVVNVYALVLERGALALQHGCVAVIQPCGGQESHVVGVVAARFAAVAGHPPALGRRTHQLEVIGRAVDGCGQGFDGLPMAVAVGSVQVQALCAGLSGGAEEQTVAVQGGEQFVPGRVDGVSGPNRLAPAGGKLHAIPQVHAASAPCAVGAEKQVLAFGV